MSFEYEESICDDVGSQVTSVDILEEQQKKTARYLQKYKREWQNDIKFKEWLEPISNDQYAAYCNVCCSSLTARKKDLMDHGETRKHKKNMVYKRNNPQLYRRIMQNIREVDANVIMDKSTPWQDDATKCLIKQVEVQHDHFYDSNHKKSNLFGVISNEMNVAGFPCMPPECQRKWESLRKSYERVLQYQVKGEFKSRFPYFNMIHRFLAKEIDPLGMREKMLAHKLGRRHSTDDPLILDGNLDGTLFSTTLITKKEPASGPVNTNDSTTGITISSCDLDTNDDDDVSSHMGLDVNDIELDEMETNTDSDSNIVEMSGGGGGGGDTVKLGGAEAVVGPPDGELREWEQGAVEVLLFVMSQVEFSSKMMGNTGQFHDSFWEKVSNDLLDYYCEVSSMECRLKWRELLAHYRRLMEQQAGRGGAATSYWQHYEAVDNILTKIHAVTPTATSTLKRVIEDIKYPTTKVARTGRGGRGRGSRGTYKQHGRGGDGVYRAGRGARRSAQLTLQTPINKHIKQEQHEDDDDDLLNENDDLEYETLMGNNPKQKMKRMQSSLLEVTQRIEMLEREVTKKNEDRLHESKTTIYGPQIVNLLTGILTEVKKFNSTRNNCCHADQCHAAPCQSSYSSQQQQQLPAIASLSNIVTKATSINTVNKSSLKSNTMTIKASSSSKGGVLRLDDTGKMHVTLADGTIAVQTETYFNKV